ncbi:MAG: transglycosylase SLT domain-containing protein [Acidobacteriota bacterium]
MAAAAPAAPSAADLASAVHAGQWAEVRRLTAAIPGPLPPAAALVAARASRALGRPADAVTVLRQALPRAGELRAALRIEAAEASLQLGRDPWPELRPLLTRSTPAAQRRAAGALAREAVEVLPIAAAREWTRRPLATALQRELTAIVARRSGDERAARVLLTRRDDDTAAAIAARWLASRPDLSTVARVEVAGALLAGGRWREAQALLSATAVPADRETHFRLLYLRARTAYRLGNFADAAACYDRALPLATGDAGRFTVAVQRARVADIGGDVAGALPFWNAAREAEPREVEGWDGTARALAALGREQDAADLLLRAPPPVRRVAGPRLAALLLLRHRTAAARAVLASLPQTLPAVRLLAIAALESAGEQQRARDLAASLLADRRAGAWRELALDLLPPPATPAAAVPATRDDAVLAVVSATSGVEAARSALARALATDPAWALLVAGGDPSAPDWSGPAHDLAAVGLETDAALLYPDAFPASTPEELAWSVRTLAAWGNPSAALTAGERIWQQLGVAAALLPTALLSSILPPSLVDACRGAAREERLRPDWLFAVVRQESRFDARARSNAGALGVGQIMPEVARQHGVSESELWDADRAYRLSARELLRLEDRFGLRLAVVAAAYNAGDAVVSSWLAAAQAQPRSAGQEPASGTAMTEAADGSARAQAIFTAGIPYRETASYVLAVREGVELARHLRAGATTGATTP